MNTNSNYIFRGFSLIAMAVLAFAMDAEVRTIGPIPARTANGAFRFPPHMLEDLTL